MALEPIKKRVNLDSFKKVTVGNIVHLDSAVASMMLHDVATSVGVGSKL